MHRKELSYHSQINLIQPKIEICKITAQIISSRNHLGKKVTNRIYHSNNLFITPSPLKLYRKKEI